MSWASYRAVGVAVGAAVLMSSAPVLAADLTGQASVIDGDTIEIHGQRTRLWGIDAPESAQLRRGADSLHYRCGAKAANDLAEMVGIAVLVAVGQPRCIRCNLSTVMVDDLRGLTACH